MSDEVENMQKAVLAAFGSREGHLAWQMLELSGSGQPCDITFYNRGPIIDTKISERISIAMMYGAGASKLRELLENVELASGEFVRFGDIWTINPMPVGGFSEAELAAADMSEVDQPSPFYNGKSLREVIMETYRPATAEELDRYIRRWIVS
ncbi:hypothetical protein ACCS70_32580 [Rhizobium ruizarguesonis]|uniref:hypothetical protein n=1 Tax=Rhizobium TaxID=379 RepID=UPI0009497869|nr:hypothetical protein [Rhizobium ruizarguesonis]MBY5881792.1 hypothetical protein [Rhizobium leguminosarum]TBY85506.1 hypothetical protein E0H40_27495 [Rhizobium leguminosarum bv. viciae]MBY5898675.1 hypothetical protein [Rhizobium leguminosarum]NEH38139.1 hypothetical protein [Rhizobium ruizarguesonis]TAT98663.1 hypothetical protein ELI53_03485 [Rhizobium ruizarguesonis]